MYKGAYKMDSTRYKYSKDGKIYNLKCAFAIRKLLKKYHYMYLVIEKDTEPDKWDVFSVKNYMRMHFRKGEEMILYAYGEDRTEEAQVLDDICKEIRLIA